MVVYDATQIPTSDIVLSSTLIFMLITLWVLKSIFHFIIVKNGAVSRRDLRLNDLDELLKRYRHNLESMYGVQPSNGFTVITARTEQSGEVELCPIVFSTECTSNKNCRYLYEICLRKCESKLLTMVVHGLFFRDTMRQSSRLCTMVYSDVAFRFCAIL